MTKNTAVMLPLQLPIVTSNTLDKCRGREKIVSVLKSIPIDNVLIKEMVRIETVTSLLIFRCD